MSSPAIVIFRTCALGDFVMSVPALGKIRECFPDHKIIFFTSISSERAQRVKVKSYVASSDKLPWMEMVMPHLVDDVVVIENLYSLSSLKEARRSLSKYNVSFVIVMIDSGAGWVGKIKKVFYSKLAFGLIPVYGWRGPASALNGSREKLYREGKLLHRVFGLFQFLNEMGLGSLPAADEIKFDLRPGVEAEAWAKSWRERHISTEQRFVALAPGFLQPHKGWPIDKFSILVDHLMSYYSDVEIVILGLSKDKEIGARLARKSPDRIHNITGETSIVQSAALMANCNLLIGNDGGAMHLGDAMGCPVISIVSGIEYPNSIVPWNNKHLAVRHSVPCSPCYNFTFCPEEHNQCIVDISVDTVINKIDLVLGKR